MSESVFRVHDQFLVFHTFLWVIRYFHTTLLATLQFSHTCVCVCVCSLCHTSARASVFRCYPSGTTLPLSDLSCTENPVCRGQKSFAFFEASEALPQAKTLLSVGYHRAFFIPAGQEFKVCQQTRKDATEEDSNKTIGQVKIWEWPFIQKPLDEVNGNRILILGSVAWEPANGSVLAWLVYKCTPDISFPINQSLWPLE